MPKQARVRSCWQLPQVFPVGRLLLCCGEPGTCNEEHHCLVMDFLRDIYPLHIAVTAKLSLSKEVKYYPDLGDCWALSLSSEMVLSNACLSSGGDFGLTIIIANSRPVPCLYQSPYITASGTDINCSVHRCTARISSNNDLDLNMKSANKDLLKALTAHNTATRGLTCDGA